MLIPFVAAALCLLPYQTESEALRRFPAQGFSIASPSSAWTVNDGVATPAGFQVKVTRQDAGGPVAASVLTLAVPKGTKSADLLIQNLAGLPARPEYLEHQALPDERIAGQDVPGVRLEWQPKGTDPLSIIQRFLVVEDRAYLLQAHAPTKDWDEYWPELSACLGTFRLIEPTALDEAAMAIPRMAAKCGTEAAWADDWKDAMERAKETGRHVLVVVHSYPGFSIPDGTAISTFMDEDLLALVRTRLVPLRLANDAPASIRDPESYGMSPSTFGAALLLVNADGEVLADTPNVDPDACFPWLRTQLERFPEPGLIPQAEDPLAQAELHLDRGDWSLASTLLDETLANPSESNAARAWTLRARLHRLRHQGPAALAALGKARAASPTDTAAIDCERAFILLRLGQTQEAQKLLETSIADAGDQALPKAMLLLATTLQSTTSIDAARPWWVRLTSDHPDSRWAWIAAAFLENEALLRATESRGSLEWPSEDLLDFLNEPADAPLGADHADKATPEAMRWLVSHQRENGSWPASTDLRQTPDAPAEPTAAAIDALATRALLQRNANAAAESGIKFLLDADERRRALDLPPVYMDYTAWSSWAQLELVADVLAAGHKDEAALRSFGSRLVGDLAARVRGNGGWSYYLSGSADGTGATEQSISFTTAAAVIGLLRAKDAGIDVPPDLIEGGLDCLEAMRAESGLFAYMLYHPSGRATHNPAPGSAGRGPACELALVLGERSDLERLTASLDLFIENASALAGEVGKALMHAGADSQGCHYPHFDYMMAARAAALLPDGQRERYHIVLLDLLMGTRMADGSYQDTPIMGRAYGTAATLLTLEALGR